MSLFWSVGGSWVLLSDQMAYHQSISYACVSIYSNNNVLQPFKQWAYTEQTMTYYVSHLFFVLLGAVIVFWHNIWIWMIRFGIISITRFIPNFLTSYVFVHYDNYSWNRSCICWLRKRIILTKEIFLNSNLETRGRRTNIWNSRYLKVPSVYFDWLMALTGGWLMEGLHGKAITAH